MYGKRRCAVGVGVVDWFYDAAVSGAEAPPGTRLYMRAGDVFKDADVVSIGELRVAREAVNDDMGEDQSW